MQDVHPCEPRVLSRRALVQYDDGNLCHNLQRDDHHQNLLLSVREENLQQPRQQLQYAREEGGGGARQARVE